MFRNHRFLGSWLLLVICLSGYVHADDDWIGRKFMPKMRCLPTVNGQVVGRGIVSAPLIPTKVEGDELWIGRAWVKKEEVVPLEEAVAYYSQVLADNPKSAAALNYRGHARDLLGDEEAAAEDWNRAIKADPTHAGSFSSRAVHALKHGKLEAALQDLNTAIKLQPAQPNFLTIRAGIRIQQKQWDAALADANEALRVDPQNSVAFHHRGMVWQLGKGNWGKALADYDESIRLDPENFAAHGNRALIRATAPDSRVRNGKQALADATHTCEASGWKVPKTLRTLAAAHAELGQFDEARKWQQKAIELAGQDEVLLAEFRTQLKLYEAGQPLRRSPM